VSGDHQAELPLPGRLRALAGELVRLRLSSRGGGGAGGRAGGGAGGGAGGDICHVRGSEWLQSARMSDPHSTSPHWRKMLVIDSRSQGSPIGIRPTVREGLLTSGDP